MVQTVCRKFLRVQAGGLLFHAATSGSRLFGSWSLKILFRFFVRQTGQIFLIFAAASQESIVGLVQIVSVTPWALPELKQAAIAGAKIAHDVKLTGSGWQVGIVLLPAVFLCGELFAGQAGTGSTPLVRLSLV